MNILLIVYRYLELFQTQYKLTRLFAGCRFANMAPPYHHPRRFHVEVAKMWSTRLHSFRHNLCPTWKYLMKGGREKSKHGVLFIFPLSLIKPEKGTTLALISLLNHWPWSFFCIKADFYSPPVTVLLTAGRILGLAKFEPLERGGWRKTTSKSSADM